MSSQERAKKDEPMKMCGHFIRFVSITVAAGIFLAATGISAPVFAERIEVAPGRGLLAAAINGAQSGDTLMLLPGRHTGPVKVAKSLVIDGGGQAVVAGNGDGTVITVDAPDVEIRGLEVTGSGLLLETQDSGIFLTPNAARARISGNRIFENLIGIYVSGANDALVAGNRIVGRSDMRTNERGNGVQIWNAPGAVIEHNEISAGRDGIFVTTSKRNIFRNNLMYDVRFAVHYMYTNDSEVVGNISRGNHIGYAIMFSTGIAVRDNISAGDRDRGILFNYGNEVDVSGNLVVANASGQGPEKCLFIYNSNKNRFFGNYLSGCDIGIQFTAGSERNDIYRNAFVGNRTQVKYVGTRWLEWSAEGQGNYWSDNSAFDLDGNGIGDAAYRPNDLTDQIIWRYPAAKLLLNSPSIQVLKWAQSEFPALHPGGVIDSHPLMDIPAELTARVARTTGGS
ncbi:MAG: nitrous oxide reductase family maturation protein NosD [Fimbriimonadaceae bacterium]|nr:nitrous oxide reductase family maturation protein NosD [Alphaproteobacteria bacterium]